MGAAIALLLVVVLVAGAAVSRSPRTEALAQLGPPPDLRPNVVVVMTDDQDVESMRVMSTVREELVSRGTTFDESFATFPLCCPSRATFLTGQYAHNHRVFQVGNGGYTRFDNSASLPVALARDGYRTGLVGKYLNGYAESPTPDVPAGWDEWHALWGQPPRKMYGYSVNHNGEVVEYRNEPADYQTDVLAGLATQFIRDSAGGSQPFFLTLFPSAPHGNRGGSPSPVPAPRHLGTLADEPFPAFRSFNEGDVTDKPGFVRSTPSLSPSAQRAIKGHYRDRLESLLAVDEAVAGVLDALRETAELSNTIVIFTSDNGFLQGHHRQTGKVKLYEESVRVPLVVMGPGIPAGATSTELVGNIDLAPTILDATDVEPLAPPDGRSLLPLLAGSAADWRDAILLENTRSNAIRTSEWMYAEHETGERELYRFGPDPYQLRSRPDEPRLAPVVDELSARLDVLEDCEAGSCP